MEKTRLKAYGVIFSFSFILNFILENLHSTLYISNTIGINNHLLLMLYASLLDALSITLVFVSLVFINKKVSWKFNKKNLLMFCLLLIIISLAIEENAVLTNRWIYSAYMPTIFGIGISPLFQLAITGLLSLFVLKFYIFNLIKEN